MRKFAVGEERSSGKFAVGDRVAVYGNFACSEGGSVRWLDGDKGTVEEVNCYNALAIRLDVPFVEPHAKRPGLINEVHPKQCRLLKPAKPRKRLYALVPSYGVSCVEAWFDQGAALNKAAALCGVYEVKEFVEVRRKK